ncbi:EGF-like domain protein, partial [Ancylostoma duodenale]
YNGDGRSCRRNSACDAAPCHPSATCVEDQTTLNVGGFTCHCPAGMMGDGIGEDGCQKSNSTICRTEGNCMNGGTCKPISATEYRCLCPEFYYGLHCEQVSACIGTPCENGGICQDAGVGKVNCACPIGFYGSLCQFEENSCGAHYTESSGNLTFPTDTEGVAAEGCDFVISTSEENSALKITFEAFKDMYGSDVGSTDCSKTPANLTLFDGASDNAPIFATFCGDSSSGKAPVIGEAITMTSSSAMLRYKGTSGSFSIKWETKKRECGYRTNLATGVLVVPQHHMDIVCDWFISAPMEKHIEIEIPSVEMNTGLELNCSANELEVFDGYTSYDAHRIVHICETTNVTTLVRSTGPFLTISFRNNVFGGSKSALHRGFTMKYRTIERRFPFSRILVFIVEIGCVELGLLHCLVYLKLIVAVVEISPTLMATGTSPLEFTSFDVPSAYQFSSAMWQQQIDIPRRAFNIFSSIERRMGLVSPFRRVNPFIPFRRQMVYQCTEDYLHLYADGQLIHDGCNAHRPPAICEKTLYGNGTIQTWNYPDGGRPGKCTYIIRADLSHAIRL